MSKKPSLRDVAKQAQVSIGTVSNVLNRPTNVSESTRLKVRNAIDMLGFLPDRNSAQTNTNSKIVGLILPLAQNPFYDELALGIEDSIAKAGGDHEKLAALSVSLAEVQADIDRLENEWLEYTTELES